MRRINIVGIRFRIILTATLFVAACILSCTPAAEDMPTEKARLLLGIGNTTCQLATRSTNPKFQNESFDGKGTFGLFVVHEEVYRRYVDGADISNPYTKGYGYINIPCILENGNVKTLDGTELYYPGNDTVKAAIWMYAPYDSSIGLNDLRGLGLGKVEIDQSQDEGIRRSDYVLGVPGVPHRNPLRAEGETIELTFRHLYTRLELPLEIDCEALSEVTPITIWVKGVETGGQADSVKMVQDTLSPGMKDTLTATAIVLPQEEKRQHSFVIRIGEKERTFREKSETAFLAGQSVLYQTLNITTDLAGDGPEDIVQPSDGVDLGLPSGLKWATCNVGANTPKEYGKYYTWEEANALKIDGWRMPTDNELDELIELAKQHGEWIGNDSIGLRIPGSNGDSLFLPAAGYIQPGSNYTTAKNTRGLYWSSYAEDGKGLYLRFINMAGIQLARQWTNIDSKLPVRLVKDKDP